MQTSRLCREPIEINASRGAPMTGALALLGRLAGGLLSAPCALENRLDGPVTAQQHATWHVTSFPANAW